MGNCLYIQQLPDLVNQLGLLYHTIESRVKMFHKLTKLHGKLYLLMSQVGFTVSQFRSMDLVLFFSDDQPLASKPSRKFYKHNLELTLNEIRSLKSGNPKWHIVTFYVIFKEKFIALCV